MIIAADIRVLASANPSGISEYTDQVMANMIALDKNIKWKLWFAGKSPKIAPWMYSSNVTLHKIAYSGRAFIARSRFTRRPFIDRMISGADVAFFPHFLLGETSPKCRRVMTWHDLSYEHMPELLDIRHQFWHWWMKPQMQAISANKIIAVSHTTANDLVRTYKIPKEKVQVVYSGISPDLQPIAEDLVTAWRIAHGLPSKFILMFGTREPRKNFDVLLRAWRTLRMRHPDLELVCMGDSGWGDRIYDENGLHIFPVVSSEDRIYAMNAASVLVYPSLLEGFGFPPLEAMACGTPVVASANSAIAEISNSACLLVDPYSVTSVANAINLALTNDDVYARLIMRGFIHIQSFDWRNTAEQTLATMVSS